MKKAALSKVKDDLSKFLRLAEKEEVAITRHGRPAFLSASSQRTPGLTAVLSMIPDFWSELKLSEEA